MFDHPRNRRRRQVKSLLKLLLLATFFWWLIVFGFRQDDRGDNNNKFGEHLDRNQIEKSQMKRHGALNNFYKKDMQYKDDDVTSYEYTVGIKTKKTTQLAQHEENLLQEFLLKNLEAKKSNDSIAIESPNQNSNPLTETASTHKKVDIIESIRAEIQRIEEMKQQISPSDAEKAQLVNPMDAKKVEQNITSDATKAVKIEENIVTEKLTNNQEILPPNDENNSKKVSFNNATEIIQYDDIAPPEIEPDEEISPYGDYGKSVTMPPEIPDNIKKLIDEGWKNHEFNEYVSNLIPLERNLHDFRSDYCRDIHKSYKKHLPAVSIIIVFYNEAWSTLLRSIYSVIDRTPSELLKEIILVDDFSLMEHLKLPLEDYIKNFTKVRLIRNKKREGLIHARIAGAKKAKGDVLVFLDSHIECTAGWLEPLIDRIARNKTNIAVPIIERINDDTFELQPRERSNYVPLGGFSWNLQFKWFYRTTTNLKNPHEPVASPTMAGGLFAIKSDYFKHLGMYDPGLDIWGGENLELSFKTWMCGGRIEIIQCSHVGHVYRKKSPYEWRTGVDVLRKNVLRVAKVWMDDYSIFYNYATDFKKVDFGNISERVKLRKDLKCKDFQWYLKNVYPERTIPSDGIAYGKIKNRGFGGKMCLTGNADKYSPPVNMEKCHGNL